MSDGTSAAMLSCLVGPPVDAGGLDVDPQAVSTPSAASANNRLLEFMPDLLGSHTVQRFIRILCRSEPAPNEGLSLRPNIWADVRNRALAVLGVALAGSQAGHLVTYQIRFGALADGIQSAGAHAYFPLVAKTTLGLAGVALIATLAFIGVARMLRSGHAVHWTGDPTYMSLLACLFTLQLALFMTQEIVEAAAAGVPPDSAVNLLLWGILGQLPVALIGAAGLRWLWSQVEAG